MYTLAAVVFFTAIICFFSEEFTRLFKKLFAIPGITLVLPLIVASYLIFAFDFWVLGVVDYAHKIVQNTLFILNSRLPSFLGSSFLISVLFLTVVSVLPVIILNFIFLKRRRRRKIFPYPYEFSTFIWVVCASLMVM